MSLVSDQLSRIADYCSVTGRTTKQIADLIGASYSQVYHFLKETRAGIKYFVSEVIDGISFYRVNFSSYFPSLLSLVPSKQIGMKHEKSETRAGDVSRKNVNGKRCNPERFEAMQITNRIKKLGYYDKTSKTYVDFPVRNELLELFESYRNRTSHEKIIFAASVDGSPVTFSTYEKQNMNRFNSYARQNAIIKGYEASVKLASKQHLAMVELWLTAHPEGSNSLYERNINMRKAYKSFYTNYLSKKIKSINPNAGFIKIDEFQRNGSLHFHIMIFGVKWLDLKNNIRYHWVKYGGGSIIGLRSAYNDPTHGWTWNKVRKTDKEGTTAQDYIQNYLSKQMKSESGFMHWVTGIRHYTTSKNLKPSHPKKDGSIRSSVFKYFPIGIKSGSTGIRSIKRKDSISFFSGAYQKAKSVLKEVIKPVTPLIPSPSLSFTPANKLNNTNKIKSITDKIFSVKLPKHCIDKKPSKSCVQVEVTRTYLDKSHKKASQVNIIKDKPTPPTSPDNTVKPLSFADLYKKWCDGS